MRRSALLLFFPPSWEMDSLQHLEQTRTHHRVFSHQTQFLGHLWDQALLLNLWDLSLLWPWASGAQQLHSAGMPSCLQDSLTVICIMQLWTWDWAQEKLAGRPSLAASLSTYLSSSICLASGHILFSASWIRFRSIPHPNLLKKQQNTVISLYNFAVFLLPNNFYCLPLRCSLANCSWIFPPANSSVISTLWL